MEPTDASERIVLLDVLRGFAVFGMFTVNMTADLPWGSAFWEQPLDIADRTVMILIELLTNGKFITIFSFLFGDLCPSGPLARRIGVGSRPFEGAESYRYQRSLGC